MSEDLREVIRAISDYEHVILDFHFEDDKFRFAGYNAETDWYSYDTAINDICGNVFNWNGYHIDDAPARLLSELTGRNNEDLVALNKALGNKFFHRYGE